MKPIEIMHCQAGSVTSRVDGSVKINFVTPELRPSEAGALIAIHGKNCCVSIVPEDAPPAELIRVDTERTIKTPGQRLRGVLFRIWEQSKAVPFEPWYAQRMETLINEAKAELP